MSGSSEIRQPQPSTLAQNHPDHPTLADLGLKEEHCMFSLSACMEPSPSLFPQPFRSYIQDVAEDGRSSSELLEEG